MKIIGITGPSGSGKTTLCSMLERDYNAKIINTDKIARSLSMDTSTEYFKEMAKLFEEALNDDGSLNRAMVAEIIFANDDKREALNRLTFKYVAIEMFKQLESFKNENADIIAIDIPLLYEAKMEDMCDIVIAVIAKDEEKIARICKRDGTTEEVAMKRLGIQNDNEFFLDKADYVINNDKSISNLENSLKEIMDKIC